MQIEYSNASNSISVESAQVLFAMQYTIIVRMDAYVETPKRKYDSDAGIDISARREDTKYHADELYRQRQVLVKTGWRIFVPVTLPGFWGICSRSGLAGEGLFIINAPGIIDPGYTGEIMCHLGSLYGEMYKSIRIAQLVPFTGGLDPDVLIFTEVFNDESLAHLESVYTSSRGQQGFGSTG